MYYTLYAFYTFVFTGWQIYKREYQNDAATAARGQIRKIYTLNLEKKTSSKPWNESSYDVIIFLYFFISYILCTLNHVPSIF